MDELKERWRVSAWKTYTQWGPDGKGFFLSDEVAPPRGETPSRASGSPYRQRPEPHFRTPGPKTRREFLNLLSWNGGSRA